MQNLYTPTEFEATPPAGIRGVLPPDQTFDFSSGFVQNQETFQFNGSASLSGTSLELTNGGTNEASSVFYTSPVNVRRSPPISPSSSRIQPQTASRSRFRMSAPARSGQTAVTWDMRASAKAWRSSSTFSKIPATPRTTRPAFLSMGPARWAGRST